MTDALLTLDAPAQPTVPPASPRKPQLPALTGVRTLLAVNIMLFHFTPPHMKYLYPVIDNSYVFVGFFFLLSGFVLAYNYADRPALDKRQFWRARFARLYPIYLLSLLLFAGHAGRGVAGPLARRVLRRGRADAAAAAGLESLARHLLEHGGVDALLRGRVLLRVPLDHSPAVAEVAGTADRVAVGHLVRWGWCPMRSTCS